MKIWALSLIALIMQPAHSEPLRFEGRVEASQTAVLASRLDGIVTEIRFLGGENVAQNTTLIILDDTEFKLAVKIAEADAARAVAARALAASEADRIAKLEERGVATDVQKLTTTAGLLAANAELERARVELDRAQLDLKRIEIRAPINGIIGRPSVAIGTYLEAKVGAPIAEIYQIDPALIAYDVPYATRLEAIKRTEAVSLDGLFESVSLDIKMPDGTIYPHPAVPVFASPTIDPESGFITVWAKVANPDGVLRPGFSVIVVSELGVSAEDGQ